MRGQLITNEIEDRVEHPRGCGYRKPGGTYVFGPAPERPCGRLPFELKECPTCHHGIHPSRGWTWVQGIKLLESASECQRAFDAASTRKQMNVCGGCPAASGADMFGLVGLLWVGKKFYAFPDLFIKESATMGISRRLSAVPRDFQVGETWVWLAHRRAVPKQAPPEDGGDSDFHFHPGVFSIFKPTEVHYVVRPDDDPDKLARKANRGVKLIRVIKAEDEERFDFARSDREEHTYDAR